MMNVNPNGVYTIDDLAEGLEVSKGTVYNLINRDGLKASRVRGGTIVKGEHLLQFLFPDSCSQTNLRLIKTNIG